MKGIYLKLILLLLYPISINSQVNLDVLIDSLPEIEKGEFKGTFVNDSLVASFLQEYLFEAEERGLNLRSYMDRVNWVLIEPESNQPPELTGMNLGKIDKVRHLILLSRSCLLDRHMLRATLFRELSHYFGLPYNIECCEIMRVNKPRVYSYAWFDDYDIKHIVYDELFAELKKLLN